jgi:hypothetical protein
VNIALNAYAKIQYATAGAFTAQAIIKDDQGQQIGATAGGRHVGHNLP